MKPRFVASLTLLLLSTAAFADSSFSRDLGTSAQPDIYVATGSGDIHVSRGGDDHVHITGHVHAGWSAFGDVSSRLRQIVDNPPITQAGNTIHIGDTNDRGLFNNISIDYEITVPVNAALNLRSGSGDLDVNNVARYLSATSGSGTIRARGIHGPAELGTGSGDIELGESGPAAVRAKTGSGSLRIHGLDGSVNARTGSGDVEVDGRITGASSVSAGSGSVRLHLTPDTRFNLEASTGSGDIHVNLPGAPQPGNDSRHHVTLPVGGGGPALEVRTGSGDIEVSPR